MNLQQQTILIVDDTPVNLDILKEQLSDTYHIKIANNGKLALKVAENHFPDIILLDIMMPEMDGYEVCVRLKANTKLAKIPVIFVTAMADEDDESKGLALGAVDYILKPFKMPIVKARIKTHLALACQQRRCEQMVVHRTRELQTSQKDAIEMLGKAGHYNDEDTGIHIWRMAHFSAALAKAACWAVDQAELIKMAAPMHDTGKIGLPDSILKAPRKLTEDEWVTMRKHTEIGYGILSVSDSPLFKLAAEIALAHHEKWDGSGYPYGLNAKQIPESARIVAIADVFDALTMKRPYKEAWSIEKSFSTIKQDAGTHFDPHLAALFLSIKDEIIDIKSYWDKQEALYFQEQGDSVIA